MYVFHPDTISELPGRLLCALHRDLCKVRGRAWGRGRRHRWMWLMRVSTLAWYHRTILTEMAARGYSPDFRWMMPAYAGPKAPPVPKDQATAPDVSDNGSRAKFLELYPGSAAASRKRIAQWKGAHKCA